MVFLAFVPVIDFMCLPLPGEDIDWLACAFHFDFKSFSNINVYQPVSAYPLSDVV
jgi:hypothetical protein